MSNYVGRFAPSPTGALHAGSLAAALASRLDALAHDGRWLLRIEDIDQARERPGAASQIIATLARLGFEPDAPIVFQHTRVYAYEAALAHLRARALVYPCGCTRKEIEDSRQDGAHQPGIERIYPGTCRTGLAPGRQARSLRLRTCGTIDWRDRSGRFFHQDLVHEVGDFVIRRADGLWAYQLAVVVDDAWQGVTDVVRGDDLVASTARQIYLQRLLELPTPQYLHIPVVMGEDGKKLSKHMNARPIDDGNPLDCLETAMQHLGLASTKARNLAAFWRTATSHWRQSHWMTDFQDRKTPPIAPASGSCRI
jgi:glutamyl-Q tRNA(Asp) synthetase